MEVVIWNDFKYNLIYAWTYCDVRKDEIITVQIMIELIEIKRIVKG